MILHVVIDIARSELPHYLDNTAIRAGARWEGAGRGCGIHKILQKLFSTKEGRGGGLEGDTILRVRYETPSKQTEAEEDLGNNSITFCRNCYEGNYI